MDSNVASDLRSTLEIFLNLPMDDWVPLPFIIDFDAILRESNLRTFWMNVCFRQLRLVCLIDETFRSKPLLHSTTFRPKTLSNSEMKSVTLILAHPSCVLFHYSISLVSLNVHSFNIACNEAFHIDFITFLFIPFHYSIVVVTINEH